MVASPRQGGTLQKESTPTMPATEEDAARAARRKEIEQRVAKARQAQQDQEKAKRKSPPPGKGLTRDELVQKMNAVPVFVVLNSSKNAVSTEDEATGKHVFFWHIEPSSAKEQLDAVVKQNPETSGLHLGVMSLGVAWPLFAGWDGAVSTSVQLEGANDKPSNARSSQIRHAIVTEPVKGIDVPVYVCGELQNEELLPVYFNKRDVAAAWVRSGRPAASFTRDKLMAVELSKFVEDMQKPVYSRWHTVNFIPSGAAVAVLSGQAAANKQVDANRAAAEQAVAVS